MLVFQLKVTLKGIEPPIWRRIQVPAEITLDHLHRILQRTMGWTNSHPHQFLVDGVRYGAPMWDDVADRDVSSEDERKVTLQEIRHVRTFSYNYHLGDRWEHEIKIEKVLSQKTGVDYPRCLSGETQTTRREDEDLILRDEANAITAYAFRNGYLETLHAGAAGFSDEEMKKLMVESSARLAELLFLRDTRPDIWTAFGANYLDRFCRDWAREGATFVPTREHRRSCVSCGKAVRTVWRFCAMCGVAQADPPGLSGPGPAHAP